MPTAHPAPPRSAPCGSSSPGYRESAAFLLRRADELENLILQQTDLRLVECTTLGRRLSALTGFPPHQFGTFCFLKEVDPKELFQATLQAPETLGTRTLFFFFLESHHTGALTCLEEANGAAWKG